MIKHKFQIMDGNTPVGGPFTKEFVDANSLMDWVMEQNDHPWLSVILLKPEENVSMSEVKNYRKKGVQAMRPYVPGEDLTGISVSPEDTPELGGMIAIGADNGAKWYVSKRFFNENYVLAE